VWGPYQQTNRDRAIHRSVPVLCEWGVGDSYSAKRNYLIRFLIEKLDRPSPGIGGGARARLYVKPVW
jgi:hypothetical protein